MDLTCSLLNGFPIQCEELGVFCVCGKVPCQIDIARVYIVLHGTRVLCIRVKCINESPVEESLTTPVFENKRPAENLGRLPATTQGTPVSLQAL